MPSIDPPGVEMLLHWRTSTTSTFVFLSLVLLILLQQIGLSHASSGNAITSNGKSHHCCSSFGPLGQDTHGGRTVYLV